MPREFSGAAALAAVALLAGCGYVGEPLPPSLNMPQAVRDLRVVQHGDRLTITFTVPNMTTDGVIVRKLARVEIRAGSGGPSFDVERWAADAKALENDIAEPGPAELQVPAREWAGQDIVFGVRAAGPKGRFGAWSNLVSRRVVAPLSPPAGLKAESTASGVRLSWKPGTEEGLAYRVYRREPGAKAENEEPVAKAEKPEWVDTTAEYGKKYLYEVDAVLETADADAASAPSAPVEVTPVDTFPPAAPSGLSAIVAVQSVELHWDRNAEPDLKGFFVYRAEADGAFQRIGDLVPAPAYSDRTVAAGKRYRYAVSAVDQAGNESARSGAVEAAVR